MTSTRSHLTWLALLLASLAAACQPPIEGPSQTVDCACNLRGVCESSCRCDPDCADLDAGSADSSGSDTGDGLCGTSCADLVYNDCTCGTGDPCAWVGDGYCDTDPGRDSCLDFSPHFDDSLDCNAASTDAGVGNDRSSSDRTGPADSSSTRDAGPADRSSGSDRPSGTDRATGVDRPTATDSATAPDTSTTPDSSTAGSCGGECADLRYTECTCSSSDPCGWSNDGYCDLEPPARTCGFYANHFDDSADCSAGTDAGNAADANNPVDAATTTDASEGPSFVQVSNPAHGQSSVTLNAIWGVVTSWSQDIWAVGTGGWVLAWDGTRWSQVSTPTTAALYGVVGTSSSNWFISGQNTTLIWNGSEFDHQDSWAGELAGVWGSHSTGVYFLLRPTSQYVQCSVLEWNGLSFDSTGSLEPSCLAIGGYGNQAWIGTTGGVYYNNGGGWNSQSSWNVGFATDVYGASPDDIWMSGTIGLLRYDSQFLTWKPVDGVPRPNGESINGVWGTGPDNIWVVGDDGLIAHYDGSAWAEIDNPVRSTGTALNDIWGSDIGGIWIVGEAGTILYGP